MSTNYKLITSFINSFASMMLKNSWAEDSEIAYITLFKSERLKLHRVLAVLSAVGLKWP